jgi:hypothetical protein
MSDALDDTATHLLLTAQHPLAINALFTRAEGSYTWTRPALVACQGLGVAAGAMTALSWLTTEDS